MQKTVSTEPKVQNDTLKTGRQERRLSCLWDTRCECRLRRGCEEIHACLLYLVVVI